MKKHKMHFSVLIKTQNLILLLLLLFIMGCKTVPVSNPVKAIDLLDSENAFYLAIPSSTDPELIKLLIKSNIKNISENDIDSLYKRINTIYCGLQRNKNQTTYQISIDGDIPLQYVKQSLTEKKGFTINKFEPQNSTNQYLIYKTNEVDFSFPSNKILCAGRNLPSMLSLYDILINQTYEPEDFYSNNSQLSDSMYEWLINTENEIHFYADKPQSFLTMLTGSNLDLKLDYVKGSLINSSENLYNINLDFMFKQEKYRKAGKTLLALAFGLTDSEIITEGTNELIINNIKINKQQLYNIFME